jgi:hypothetical protein
MENRKSEISPEESLRIITSMIEATKHNIGDSSHFFLLWGYAVAAGCTLQYILKAVVGYQHHYYAWFVTLIAMVIHFVFLYHRGKTIRAQTFVEEANANLWMAMGMSFFVLAFVFARIGWQYCFPIYILLYGVGTYVSGSLIQFKPLVIGGVICWFLAAITPYLYYDLQILMAAIAIIVSYIIPGHLLRLHYLNNKSVYGAGKAIE